MIETPLNPCLIVPPANIISIFPAISARAPTSLQAAARARAELYVSLATAAGVRSENLLACHFYFGPGSTSVFPCSARGQAIRQYKRLGAQTRHCYTKRLRRTGGRLGFFDNPSVISHRGARRIVRAGLAQRARVYFQSRGLFRKGGLLYMRAIGAIRAPCAMLA